MDCINYVVPAIYHPYSTYERHPHKGPASLIGKVTLHECYHYWERVQDIT